MKKLLLLIAIFLLESVVVYSQMIGEFKSKFDFAQEKYNLSNYAYVIETCNDIIMNGYKRPEVYQLRAKAYRAVGDYNKAVSDYLEAIQYGKKEPDIYIDIAQVYACLKQFDKSETALNEALRISREEQPLKKNSYILEELGRINHYLGNYKEAIINLKQAIDNGSTIAYIDLLSASFRSGDLYTLRNFTDTLLIKNKLQADGILRDSSLFHYVSSLNDISKNQVSGKTLAEVENAFSYYSNNNNRCYQGFLNDLMALKGFVQYSLGYDKEAYETYKKMYATNSIQIDIKYKIDELKAKLKLDVTPPALTLKNPILDDNNTTTFYNKTKYEIYAQATDSAGIASVTVNKSPVSKLEDDGLFVYDVDLQPGVNEIEIVATDKNDNKTINKFTINNVSEKEASTDDLSAIPELVASATYHAILIAESDYQDPKFADLTNPIKDVQELKDILVKDYTFDEKNIMMITNGSRLDILDSLEKKCKSLTQNDNLIIYYAGHGTIRKVGTNIEGGYLIPSDAIKDKWGTCISSNDLVGSLKATEAKHILFLVDACFGGALFRSSIDEAPKGIKQSYTYQSRKILTSGNLEEVPDNGKYFLNLKTFLQTNTNKFTTAADLYLFIKNNSDTTTPQYEKIKDLPDIGGQFVFIHK